MQNHHALVNGVMSNDWMLHRGHCTSCGVSYNVRLQSARHLVLTHIVKLPLSWHQIKARK